MPWPINTQPFGKNRQPVITGLSSVNGRDVVPIAVDPATGAVITEVELTAASLPAAMVNGQQTVTTSAVALPSNVLEVGVILEALSTNTVSIFIGGPGVTTATGTELQPGASTSAAIANMSGLYVICASGSPVITWLGS